MAVFVAVGSMWFWPLIWYPQRAAASPTHGWEADQEDLSVWHSQLSPQARSSDPTSQASPLHPVHDLSDVVSPWRQTSLTKAHAHARPHAPMIWSLYFIQWKLDSKLKLGKVQVLCQLSLYIKQALVSQTKNFSVLHQRDGRNRIELKWNEGPSGRSRQMEPGNPHCRNVT